MDDKYDLGNYFNGKKTTCREERQYALFLYNALLNMKKDKSRPISDYEKKIKNDLFGNEDVSVEHVFYEAALLRDYHHNNRVDFNERLLKFCMCGCGVDITGKLPECFKSQNLGNKNVTSWIKGKCPELAEFGDEKKDEIRLRLLFAKCMMQAKPDIMVIYGEEKEQKKEQKALSIECKYESGNGKYKDLEGAETIHQERIQECIMAFLFGKRFEKIEEVYDDKCKGFQWEIEKDLINREKDEDSYLFQNIKNMGVKHVDFKKRKKAKKGHIYISYKKLIENIYVKQ